MCRMVFRRFLFLPVLFVIAVNLASAPVTGLQRPSRSSESKKGAARLQVLQREFPKLADSALALQNVGLKIWTLSSLADLMWATDPTTARALFQKTYGLLRAIEPAENQQPTL